jgi:hypothetical protein
VGASPTRQPFQPEATGAVMEVTKWLKPLVSVSRIGDRPNRHFVPSNFALLRSFYARARDLI